MTMVIDAAQRFAKRTANWMLKSGMPGKKLEERLAMFEESHIRLIGEQARKVRGQPSK